MSGGYALLVMSSGSEVTEVGVIPYTEEVVVKLLARLMRTEAEGEGK